MSAIIKTENLDFAFQPGVKTLDQVSLSVPEGAIYGFLGPNGAGKTTTLRLLLGLLRNQHGTIELFGQDFSRNRIMILKKLGSLIEQPSLYGHLTARENLEIYRVIHQCAKSRIDEVLQIVGLENTGRKKARQFSLGMKQRLSIAVALVHEPELLLLDEPTNGLDPNGIIEVRELIKKLNREQHTTILVSSHILSEVEKMATHVGIIHHGKLLFQGTMAELQLMKKSNANLEIETSDNAKALALLQQAFAVQEVEGRILLPLNNREESAQANRILVQNGIDVYALHPQHSNLEQLFLDITSENK
ncbi:MAG: ATP-binding cassette domain-containing protein [Terrimonas sp.]|nr:ATP-binding cassette domain-containing protein [Terrimonas sp.]